MTVFSFIAIPFFILALIMLAFAIGRKKPVFLILGGVFMASSVVNAVIGMSL